MSNLEKIEEMMKSDPTLQEKLAAETKRLTDSGEKDIRKISAEAIKAVYGVDLTDEELDQVTKVAAKASTKLDLDELDNIAGGCSTLGEYIAASTGMCVVSGAMAGGAAGTAVPLLGNALGLAAGATIGAVIGVALGSISYVKNEM